MCKGAVDKMLNKQIFVFSIIEIILAILLLFIMINKKQISPFMLDFLIVLIGILMIVALIIFIVVMINK